MKYLVIIEPAETGFSAHTPDLPGCIATGADIEEVQRNMREAIAFHLEGLMEEGLPVPAPAAIVDFVEAGNAIRTTAHPS